THLAVCPLFFSRRTVRKNSIGRVLQADLPIALRIAPTMASSTPPPTPPPAMLPITEPTSMPPEPAPTPSACSSAPPRPPPRIPTIELPSVPRLNFLSSPPAMFPPTAPEMSCTSKVTMSMSPPAVAKARQMITRRAAAVIGPRAHCTLHRVAAGKLLEPQVHLDLREQRRGIEVGTVVARAEYVAGHDVMRRAVDVDSVHVARARLAAMRRRDAGDDVVDQALLDGEFTEPGGQRHPHHAAEQQVDAPRAAVVTIAGAQQQHATVLVEQHDAEFAVEVRRQLQGTVHGGATLTPRSRTGRRTRAGERSYRRWCLRGVRIAVRFSRTCKELRPWSHARRIAARPAPSCTRSATPR